MKRTLKYLAMALCVAVVFIASACKPKEDTTKSAKHFVGIAVYLKYKEGVKETNYETYLTFPENVNLIVSTSDGKLSTLDEDLKFAYVGSSENFSDISSSNLETNTVSKYEDSTITMEVPFETIDFILYYVFLENSKYVLEKQSVKTFENNAVIDCKYENLNFNLVLVTDSQVKDEYVSYH